MFAKLTTKQEETLAKLLEEQKKTVTEFSTKQRENLIKIIEEQNKINGCTKADIDKLNKRWSKLSAIGD